MTNMMSRNKYLTATTVNSRFSEVFRHHFWSLLNLLLFKPAQQSGDRNPGRIMPRHSVASQNQDSSLNRDSTVLCVFYAHLCHSF